MVGRVGGSSRQWAFTPSVNSSGEVTLDQERAIAHTPNSGPDQESSLLSANLVKLVAPSPTSDGDSQSASVDLGSAISFKDDGPSISAGSGPTTVCRWTKATCHQCQHQLCQPVHQQLWRRWGRHPLVYSLNVSAAGADSGLNDTATGQTSRSSGEWQRGWPGGGSSGSVAFTPSVNSSGR